MLDHAIVNFDEKFKIINHTINNDFSDHNIILSEIRLSCKTESKTFTKNITDFESFRQNLIENLSAESNCFLDVDSYCNFIIDSLNTALIGSTESALVHKRRKDILCQWVNEEIKKLTNYKHSLIKKICNCQLDLEKQILKSRLKAISSVVSFKKTKLLL